MMQKQPVTNIKPELTVAAALEQYLTENGFSTKEYTAPTFSVSFGPFSATLRNSPARQAAIALHDLHHLATGYGTDLAGEGEISAFELRAGCTNAFLWAINLAGFFAGLLVAPRRTLHAWRRARGAVSLYKLGGTAEAMKPATVAELRARLGLPEQGLADLGRHLHARAPVAHAA
jgi:hypothetical protein